MAIIKLDAHPREETGTRAVRRLRADGFIPGNLYSHGQPATSIKLPAIDWSKHLTDQLNLVNIAFPDGGNQVAAVREIQRDPMSQEPLHVDFQAVKMDEATTFTVMIKFKGVPVGTKEGGVKTISNEYMEIECLPGDVPDEIDVDITSLEIGDSINAGDIKLPENLTLESDPNMTLISITLVRTVEEDEVKPEEVEGEVVEGGAAEAEAAQAEE